MKKKRPAEESRKVCLRMENIVKQFPRVLANDDVSIYLREGEILALLGENGAGKSTLMNILYGLYRPTSGDIFIHDEKVVYSSPKDAIALGLGMVHQHFMLVGNITVTENVILGNEPGRLGVVDYKKAREEVVALSEKYFLKVDPDAITETLPVGLQQRVEILKALYRNAKILILDEPTAVLTPQEVNDLLAVLKRLVESNVSLIIITHKLEEVKAISDRVYILQRGKITGEHITKDVEKAQLATEMVGRDVVLTAHRTPGARTGSPVFSAKNLTLGTQEGMSLREISFGVRPGEIVGIAGVDGNGQTELAEVIRGLRKADSGTILLNGREITNLSTRELMVRKMGYVPSDRHRFGLVLPFSVADNIAIGYHLTPPNAKAVNMNHKYIDAYAQDQVEAYDIRTPGTNVAVSTLSGGNQQKVILARELGHAPEFLLVSQPTRGLDVGAIEYIHSEILKMRDKNVAILLISLELEEIFALSDRILVLYEGQITKEFVSDDTNEIEVGLYMTGGGGNNSEH